MDQSPSPLIILGAGASHDFVHPPLNFTPPPTTDQLVLHERRDEKLIRAYPAINELFSYMMPLVLREKNPLTFEEALQQITSHEERTALLFYLSDYFNHISHNLRGQTVNNFSALRRYIRNSPTKTANVFTFNYDTLFEPQLEGWPFMDMGQYVNPTAPIRLFKLHGSSDWFYIHRKSAVKSFTKPKNGYEMILNEEKYKGEHFHTAFHLQETAEGNDFHRIPALALPIEATKAFVMPDTHIHLAKYALSQTPRILIIGWKGADKHLLDLMNEHLPKKVPTYLVTGPSGGKEVRENLAQVNKLHIQGEVPLFSNFISSEMASEFFNAPKN